MLKLMQENSLQIYYNFFLKFNLRSYLFDGYEIMSGTIKDAPL